MISPEPAPAPSPSSSGTSPATSVLVIDDQPTNIQIVGMMLGKLGYEIIPAVDGPTAFRRLAVRRPDLILLDLLMPDLDGCEVCRQLKANPDWRDIPVIFLSAADDKELIVRALESGGVDYVTKPFHLPELVSRVRTHVALKSARDQLKKLAEDKDELMGILTHDLKNHLSGVLMSAQVLRTRLGRPGPIGTDAPRLAENIENTSGYLLTFVKEFLANSAVDHGLSLHPVRLDISSVAAVVIERCREPARRKELTLEADLAAEDTCILADAPAVTQVLENLVSNALKFSPPGRTVKVSTASHPTHVEIRISDQGPGFTPEDRTLMFRRYTRLSARPTGGEPSTGLGLSIVHKLVLAMNGEVSCQSQPGKGATFEVRLPRTLPG